ncbi:MAG: hypothetical protein GY710_10420 [Desulfobacteraceae bacterium]|nr:hypothetical protein [Desulfobacteraceae bacterium]
MFQFGKAYKSKVFGVFALVVYLYALADMKELFPGLIAAKDCGNPRALFGFALVVSMPVIGILCLLIPGIILEQFSYNVEILTPLVVNENFIHFIGYLILVVSMAVFTLFMK